MTTAATAAQRQRQPPSGIVLMGVSGCGKTTLGDALARALGWHFADADDFHPPANIAKMHAGHPLSDADRAPWLAALQQHLARACDESQPTVLACSALKKSYRQRLFAELPRDALRLVYLRGNRALLATRLASRSGHFMPPSLLDSQLATLEEPTPDEAALVLDIARPPSQLVSQICYTFALRPISPTTPDPAT